MYGVTGVTDEEITIIDKAIAALENSVEVSHNGSKSAVRFNLSLFNFQLAERTGHTNGNTDVL